MSGYKRSAAERIAAFKAQIKAIEEAMLTKVPIKLKLDGQSKGMDELSQQISTLALLHKVSTAMIIETISVMKKTGLIILGGPSLEQEARQKRAKRQAKTKRNAATYYSTGKGKHVVATNNAKYDLGKDASPELIAALVANRALKQLTKGAS